jgi:hypothetical protein
VSLSAQTWAGISGSLLAPGVVSSASLGCCLAPIDMHVARLLTRATRSARLPGSRLATHTTPPIANMPSGQASIQISEVIMAVVSF